MYKEIEAYVENLSVEDCQKTLVQSLCDISNEAGIEDIDELKDYIKDSFEKAAKHVRSVDEDGPDE